MPVVNKAVDLQDMNLVSVVAILNDIYRFMGIPLAERSSHRRRKGRSLFEPTTLESVKHWDFTWAILNGGLTRGMKVLDCGSGRGVLQFYLSHIGLDVYANDVSDASSKLFRYLKKIGIDSKRSPTRVHDKLNRKYRTDVKFVNESAAKMSFPDNSFDRVFSISVIEHMPDDVVFQSMREMERVLKPGGLLLMTFDFHPVEKEGIIGFTAQDFMKKVVSSFTRCHIVGNEPDFRFPDWDRYITDVNEFFKNPNLNTSYGVIFEKR